MLSLTPDKARIFRITHIDNIPWAITHGLHCRNSDERDPDFKEIGNPDIISKRASKQIPIGPGGTLSDYLPFYFTPYSPMLLNIKPDMVVFGASRCRIFPSMRREGMKSRIF